MVQASISSSAITLRAQLQTIGITSFYISFRKRASLYSTGYTL